MLSEISQNKGQRPDVSTYMGTESGHSHRDKEEKGPWEGKGLC